MQLERLCCEAMLQLQCQLWSGLPVPESVMAFVPWHPLGTQASYMTMHMSEHSVLERLKFSLACFLFRSSAKLGLVVQPFNPSAWEKEAHTHTHQPPRNKNVSWKSPHQPFLATHTGVHILSRCFPWAFLGPHCEAGLEKGKKFNSASIHTGYKVGGSQNLPEVNVTLLWSTGRWGNQKCIAVMEMLMHAILNEGTYEVLAYYVRPCDIH